jgi:hypothetical protein
MEVQFDFGVMTGDGSDAEMLVEWARPLEAKAAGVRHLGIGIEGGRTKTVADIGSIRIEAQF